jgi:hypothetical protein
MISLWTVLFLHRNMSATDLKEVPVLNQVNTISNLNLGEKSFVDLLFVYLSPYLDGISLGQKKKEETKSSYFFLGSLKRVFTSW